MFDNIRSDLAAGRGNLKSCFICSCFRLAFWCHAFRLRNRIIWLFFLPYLVFYRFFVEWVLCVEIPHKTIIGGGIRIEHGHSLVINDRAVIGRNVILRHCTTIGVKEKDGGSPVIGNDVDIGSNVVILGDILIGDGAVVGAGSVVVKNVPPFSVVAGNPAKVIRMASESDRPKCARS